MDAVLLRVVLFASFAAGKDVLRLSGNIQARCLTDSLLIQISKNFTDAKNFTFFVRDHRGTELPLSPSLNAMCGYKQQLNHKGDMEITVSFVGCHVYLQRKDGRLQISIVVKHTSIHLSDPGITENLSLSCPYKPSNLVRRVVCEEAYIEVSQKLDAQFINNLNGIQISGWLFEVRDRAGRIVVRNENWLSAQGVALQTDRREGLVTVRLPHSSPLITSKDHNGFHTLDYSIVAKNRENPRSRFNLSAVCPVAQVSCLDGKVFASAANVKLLASPHGAVDRALRMQLDGITLSQEDSTARGFTLSLGEQQLQLSYSALAHPPPNSSSSEDNVNWHRMSMVHIWRSQDENQDSRAVIHLPTHSCHSPTFTVSVTKAEFNVTYGPVPASYSLKRISVDGKLFYSPKKPRGGLRVELLPGENTYYVSLLARLGSRLVPPQYVSGLVSQYSITPALSFQSKELEEHKVKGEVFTHTQEDIVLPTLEGYCRNNSVCFKVSRGSADQLWRLHIWDSAFQPQRAAERLHSLDNYRNIAHLCVDIRSPDLLHQRVSKEGQMLVLGVAYRVLPSGQVKVAAQHACPFPPAEELTCTAERQFVVSGLRLSASPHAQLDLVTLRDPSCGPTAVSNETVSFTFPVTACGTIRKTQDGFVEYENTISNRDSLNESAPEYLKFDSTLICRYSMMNATFLKSREELHSGLLPARSNGKFQLHMDIMKDDSFLEEFHEEEYPVLRRIGEPVFVEVGIRSSDPQVEIFVKDCWGSPSADPEHPLTWSIIKDSCEVTEDEYSTIFHKVHLCSRTPLSQHYKHFEVKTFTFVKPQLRGLLNHSIHFHCSVVICDLAALSNDKACQAQCIPDKQRAGRSAGSERTQEVVVTSGSVQLIPALHSKSTAFDADSEDLEPLPCVMAVLSSMLIFCLLLEVFWSLQSNCLNKNTRS